MKPQTILVAVDFSEASGAAYREARTLSAALGVDLVVLHVVELRDGEQQIRAANWMASWGVDPHEIISLPGTPWVQIARYAEEIMPLMLVVGSHGRAGYQPLAPGSTTAVLTVRSPVPILVVSARASHFARREVLNNLHAKQRGPDV